MTDTYSEEQLKKEWWVLPFFIILWVITYILIHFFKVLIEVE